MRGRWWLVLLVLAAAPGMVCGQPAGPYAVEHVDVVFESRGARLAGTLWLPQKPGPHPAIVGVHGSGRIGRDDPYQRQIAEYFSARGLAVLTFDKRGVGRSEGRYPGSYGSSMIIYANDALAAVDFLAARADIDAAQIGLWGISQAGWIIPVAAVISEGAVAFTIIVSGPTVSIGEENLYSDLTGDTEGRPTGLPRDEIARRLAARGPFGFDHYALIEEMTRPGLWIYGALDQSVPVAESIADLEAIKAEWGRDFTWQVFPNANHGLRVARTGGRWERPIPVQTAPGYLEAMERWLIEHVGLRVP